MKKILITGGPTNEYIDEVMKITNMSTGSLSRTLAKDFANAGYEVTAVFNNSVNVDSLEGIDNIRYIWVETTDDMLKAIESEKETKYDAIIHAAAVGDYTADFSFLLEGLAEELFGMLDQFKSPEDILKVLEDPKCKIDDSSKISSYQKNLTVKLGLTPKIIGRLREWYPDTLLIGCKLLENVPKEELYDVATHLAEKNDMDYIMANDLADLRHGQMARHICTKDGYTGISLATPDDIFKFVDEKLK